MTDSMGIWLQRFGIVRQPKGSGSHAQIVEVHISLIKDSTRLLDTDARQRGLNLSLFELLTLATSAKNCSIEFGGFSATQSLFGTAPGGNWARAEPTDDDSMEGKFTDALVKRMLAHRALRQAIYDARFKIAQRRKSPQISRDDFKVGQEVEVYYKPEMGKKDITGWRRPCVIVGINEEGAVEYRWQGKILSAPPHLVREAVPPLAFLSCLLYPSDAADE